MSVYRMTEDFVGMGTMGANMTIDTLQCHLQKSFQDGDKCMLNTVELMCHPGYQGLSENGGCGIGPDDFNNSSEREHEMDILTSKSMADFYKNENIHLISFRQLVEANQAL